jgi:beta-lactam-binding protein with PASTA domain
MKHLADVPPVPSSIRPEIPEDLDLVVVRALAKEPADRYQSAAAMDADLETVARGGHVAADTADAATMVLTGERSLDATAATVVTRRGAAGGGPPPQYEPPSRSRPLWPWLVGLGAVLALAIGGWFAYQSIQEQIAGNQTVAVPYVVGLQESQAANLITEKGLVPRVNRASNSDVPEGTVFAQNPTEGTRVDKETVIRIDVSSGKPEVKIPSVVGQSVEDAVAELTQAGLDAQVVEVNSDKDTGTVTAQSPAAGTVVVEGTQVRINVSKGPKPLAVPNVIGLPYDQAAAELQRVGFNAARINVDSALAAGIVVSQDPTGGSQSAKGTTVTLSVSKGPSTSAVPDVTSQDVAIAQTTLEAAGFRTRVVLQDTTDPTMDGIVLSQDPVGGTQAKPNALVTLFVGRLTQTTTTTTTTPTTPTTPQ